MQYNKPPISFEAQADLLIERGLIADKPLLIDRLKNVNYYRLSGYLYFFRDLPGDAFKSNTTLERVWRHYTFDRHLRMLVMDAVERAEVAVRTQLIYHFAHRYGPFGYLDPKNLPELDNNRFDELMRDLRKETERSREVFVTHFFERYGDCHHFIDSKGNKHPELPLWMIGEIMAFGKMLTMFNGCTDDIRRQVARHFGTEDEILRSWLKAINTVRNICAHHARLWNKDLPRLYVPKKQKYPQWHTPVHINTNRIFGALTVLMFLLKKSAPQSQWKKRLLDLLDKYPEIPLASMGFPANWKECPIWQ